MIHHVVRDGAELLVQLAGEVAGTKRLAGHSESQCDARTDRMRKRERGFPRGEGSDQRQSVRKLPVL
jgi:hypothetical protein